MDRELRLQLSEDGAENVDSDPRVLVFESSASKQVETNVLVRRSSGDEITGNHTLVVDAPNSMADSAEYRLPCREGT